MFPLQIAENIYDVGVQDWAVRDFHGYKTERGATYNSYLIMDEKITLIDTVKAPFTEELLANISKVTPLDSIDYIVINMLSLTIRCYACVSQGLPQSKVLYYDARQKRGYSALRRYFCF